MEKFAIIAISGPAKVQRQPVKEATLDLFVPDPLKKLIGKQR
jgi:hypothetical protein